MTTVEFETISWLVSQTTSVKDQQQKQSFMTQLENCEKSVGFIRSLVKLIDLQDLGSQTKWEDRQLAAILLKNAVLKILQHEESRAAFKEEINIVKSFLLRSFGEPQHQVFLQLHTLCAKLASMYWPNEWPELFPSIVAVIEDEKANFMSSFEATVCLHEVLVELSCKSARCSNVNNPFHELCLKLFCPISKNWAMRMKTMQTYFVSFTNSIPGQADLTGANNYQFPRDESHEVNIFYAMIMSKILKILIETAFQGIMKNISCFPCLWKTYMSSISIVANFIRKVRPHFVKISEEIRASNFPSSSGSASAPSSSQFTCPSHFPVQPPNLVTLCVLERFYALDVDDFNAAVDFEIFPAHQLNQHFPQYKSLFVVINLGMKLLKVMNCLPVHLQRKYPLEIVPLLKDLVVFYHKFLMDEVSTDMNLNSQRLKVLPMYAVQAGVVFLGNVINCTAYKNYSIYQQQGGLLIKPTSGKSGEQNGDNRMEDVTFQSAATTANALVKEFFDAQKARDLFERLLARTMHYNENTLEIWYETPEKFFLDEHSEGMDYTFLRIASESLFVALLQVQPKVILDMLMGLLQDLPRQSAVTSSSSNNNEILLWDAIYTCAGLAVEPLSKSLGLSPTDWLLGIIGPLFNNLLQSNACGALQPCGQQILRSRMLKLISAWISQFDPKVHSTILTFLINLLAQSSNSDVVVRLSTVKTLSSLINTKDFDYKSLVPVVIPCVQALIALITQLQESENQKTVLELIKDIIDIIGVQKSSLVVQQVEEIANVIMENLLGFWKSLSPDDVIRCTLLEVLTSAVHAFKGGDAIHSNHLVTLLQVGEASLSNIYCKLSNCANNKAVVQAVKPLSLQQEMLFPSAALNNNNNASRSDMSTTTTPAPVCVTCDESFLTLESLLLLATVARNLPKPQQQPDLFLFDAFLSVFNTLSVHILFSNDNLFSAYGEANGKLILERICFIIEGFAFAFPTLFFQDPRNAKLLNECYLKLFRSLSPKHYYPILRLTELLLFVSPQETLHLLQENGILLIIFKCCLVNCDCPNLATLLASYQGGQGVSLSALNIVLRLLLDNTVILLKLIQVIKEEILEYLRKIGVVESNLSEHILLDQILCVLVKAVPYLEATQLAGEAVLGPLRLRNYCVGLWSFIAPTKDDGSSSPSNESLIPNLLLKEELQKWLPEIFRITALYMQKCEEFFFASAEGRALISEWKSLLYVHIAGVVKGPYPMRDGQHIAWSNTNPIQSNAANMSTDLAEQVYYKLQDYEQIFRFFLEETVRKHQEYRQQRQQGQVHLLSGETEPQEEEELIVGAFFEVFGQNAVFRSASFDNYFCERCHTIMNVFGRDSFNQLIANSFTR